MMISLLEIYHVIVAIIPLYVAMAAAYLSMKRWKIFTPDQCAGINKFVANFSIPLLSFEVISSNNPYEMNPRLVGADFLQKLIALILLSAIAKIKRSRGARLRWVVTGLSLSTLPNTLILGIPMMRAMYGEEAGPALAQIVVLQSLVWYNLLLILFEIDDVDEPRPNARILVSTVGKKLVRNPNTWATLAGLMWASIHFRMGVNFPRVIENSISILSDGGLGMAMFSLGLFMASQARLIACGARKALLAMAMKFVVGPSLMAVASFALGLKGTLLRVAIVQAALPQGIVPFVFAKEYDVYPDILSTSVISGLLVAVPVGLAYYFLLAL